MQSVLSLRDEYRADIDIRLGFEAEYYPDLFESMLRLLEPYPVDYLLLAQHFNDSGEAVYNPSLPRDREALSRYVDRVVDGMETGRFSCVAHPDLFYFAGPEEIYRAEMGRLCRRARELDMPLEINILGMRSGRCYPNEAFWPLAKAEGCRVVLGSDAHDPEDVAAPDQVARAMAFAGRFGIAPEQEIALRKPF